MTKPKQETSTEKELRKADEKFEEFKENISVSNDVGSYSAPESPPPEVSEKERRNSKDTYLKPHRSFPPGADPKTGKKETFNEKFRKQYEEDKEYIQFIAENSEIRDETLDLWTKPYPGIEAEEWAVPVNRPVWGPKYLYKQIKRKFYRRMVSEDRPVSAEGGFTYTGCLVVKNIIHRLDAHQFEKSHISLGSRVVGF